MVLTERRTRLIGNQAIFYTGISSGVQPRASALGPPILKTTGNWVIFTYIRDLKRLSILATTKY